MITQEYLKKHFIYDDKAGTFLRILKCGNVRPADFFDKSNGYMTMSIMSKNRYCHRMAWLYVYGELPSLDIDHIDGNRKNNAITNLRLATRSENLQNRKAANKGSKVSHLGVDITKTGKYRARIFVKGKEHHLGKFNTLEEALAARKAGELLYHPFSATVVTSRK